MIGVAEFLQEIKDSPVPDGFGLIFVDGRRSGRDIIQVDNPRFMFPLPIEDQDRLKRLLVVSPEISSALVQEMEAVPVETMANWFRFAMWEESEA